MNTHARERARARVTGHRGAYISEYVLRAGALRANECGYKPPSISREFRDDSPPPPLVAVEKIAIVITITARSFSSRDRSSANFSHGEVGEGGEYRE